MKKTKLIRKILKSDQIESYESDSKHYYINLATRCEYGYFCSAITTANHEEIKELIPNLFCGKLLLGYTIGGYFTLRKLVSLDFETLIELNDILRKLGKENLLNEERYFEIMETEKLEYYEDNISRYFSEENAKDENLKNIILEYIHPDGDSYFLSDSELNNILVNYKAGGNEYI